jgi:hypothetical protein
MPKIDHAALKKRLWAQGLDEVDVVRALFRDGTKESFAVLEAFVCTQHGSVGLVIVSELAKRAKKGNAAAKKALQQAAKKARDSLIASSAEEALAAPQSKRR